MARNGKPTNSIELDELAVDTLLTEYEAIKAEHRNAVNAMDANFRYLVTAIAGVASIRFSSGVAEILYLIPSVMFIFAVAHMGKSATQSVLGTYLHQIELKLQAMLGKDKIAMNWQNSKLREYFVSFSSAPQMSTNIIFAIFTILFAVISYFAYLDYPMTLYVHGIEFVLFFFYAFSSTRLVSGKRREEYWGSGDGREQR